ncbi:MAG: hypothetical protein PHI34_00635 [Acidobacteriota bacterium]|nr:hypothetical protein [Acidobacteriota bacterium]
MNGKLGFEYWAGRLRGPARQTLVLSRHFFQRLFQNDVFAFGDQMKEKVYLLLAMVATLGWAMTQLLFAQYMFIEDAGQSWLEKMAFLFFFMLFLGLVVVLEWDVLFPDARDHLNLTPLPVRPRTIISAKFAAFAYFVAAYTVAVSALSVFAIILFLPRWNGDTLGSLAAYAIAHVAAGAAAYAFVFLLFLFLEAVLMAVLGERIFRTVSLVLRFALTLGVAVIMVLAMTDLGAVQRTFEWIAGMRASRPAALLWWPPVWFVSIYECLIGRSSPFYQAGANIGLAAILGLALACRMAMSAGYRRLLKRAGEVRTRRHDLRRKWGRIFAAGTDRVLFRSQTEKAVFHFMSGTMRKSALHKVRLAGSLAFSLSGIMLIVGLRHVSLTSPAQAKSGIMGAPLALGFFLLLGLRSAFNIPYAAAANWAFQMTEREDRRPYYMAVKKLVLIGVILPLVAVTVVIHAGAWGAGPTALHAMYVLAWLVLFAEALFWKYSRIPFTCKVVPGKAKLYMRWLPYIVAFVLALTGLTALEKTLLAKPGRFVVFLAAIGAIMIGLEIYQRRFIYPRLAIVFEEEPEQVMISL